jgi:ABC-type transport system substrate-binding protein
MVVGSSENAYVKFAQNPGYWGRNLTASQLKEQPLFDPGHVKNVIVYAKADDVARYTDLVHGTVQIADIQASDWNVVAGNPQFNYVKLPPWAGLVSLLGLNTAVYPTNITLVRQAIVHAINYTDLYQKAYLGQMTPYVGPEYPAWKSFYDLGGFQPYQYNLTLARQDLAAANITNMPTFQLRIETGCEACIDGAQVIQSDLAQIGINVNIQVLTGSDYLSVYGSYSNNRQNAQQIGQLSWVDGGEDWGAYALTPADYWLSFVSNASLWGNWAAYSNPVVQRCVDAFAQSSNDTQIQQLCTAAQKQIYEDAPYAWIGVSGLWLPTGGSTVWNKNVISGLLLDPTWGGQSSVPFFNTVTFTNASSSS